MAVYSKIILLVLVPCIFAGCVDDFVLVRRKASASAEHGAFPLASNIVKIVIGDTSTRDPHYMTNSSGEVVKIPMGCGFILPQQIPIEPYVIIQQLPVIRALCDELRPSHSSDQGVTFSGVLSEQFYLDREDQLVLHTFIICEDSTVVLSTNGSVVRMDNEYRFVPPTNDFTNLAIKRPEYVRHIYSLMQDHAPEQVQKRKVFYRRIGIDFEKMLLGEQKQSAPKTENSYHDETTDP